MNVPLFNLSIQHQKLAPELTKAFETVLGHGQFILGPEVESFEAEAARACESKHAIACASGSDALLLALQVLGIGPGDEVITTPYSFFATASCIARVGARAVFADICPHCYNLHPREVLKKVTPKTKAILPVHLYGQAADMAPYLDLCKQKKIALIEDTCQAIGARYQGQQVGSFGDLSCISFFPTKNLGGFGDGGLITTNRDDLVKSLKVLRVHGMEPKYYHSVLGINSRMDTLQAALLRVKLPHLEAFAEARNQNARYYIQKIVEAGIADSPLLHESCLEPQQTSKPILLPASRSSGHVYNQFVIRTKNPADRDPLRDYLKSKGIGSEIYYPLSLHQQQCFAFWGYKTGDFPISEMAGKSTLALPIYPELTEPQLLAVIAALKQYPWTN